MINYPGYALHQVGPYIGKIRPSLARQLVMNFSEEGDWIWDPFCGSGTVPLECRLLSRHIIAADINPYACSLTRAKLHAPSSENACLSKLSLALSSLEHARQQDLGRAPRWVKSFFHSRSLKETKALLAELIRRKQFLNAGCLIGILHHQRPGFLSYPSSHLVPYLRDRLYPRAQYPQLYKYRNPIPRLRAKIRRTLRNPPPPLRTRFRVLQESALKKYLPDASVDAVITSPPYMGALDYARDNRLRMWFLGVPDYKMLKAKELGKVSRFEEDMRVVLNIIAKVIRPGGSCVLVIGDLVRKDRMYHLPSMILRLVQEKVGKLVLEDQLIDTVPNDRRARRNGRGTRTESILVFRRKKG